MSNENMEKIETVDEKHESVIAWVAAVYDRVEEMKTSIGNMEKDITALKMNAALGPKDVKELNDIKVRVDKIVAMDGMVGITYTSNDIQTVTVDGIKQTAPKVKAKLKDDKPQYLKNVNEYFKYIYATNRNLLFERGIITEKLEKDIIEEKSDALSKKKTDADVMRAIATHMYKKLSTEEKDILQALKVQDINKWNETKADILT